MNKTEDKRVMKMKHRPYCIDLMDIHALEFMKLNKTQINKANQRQTTSIKQTLRIMSQNHNTLLKLMFGVIDTETMQHITGINLSQKHWKMKPHTCHKMMFAGWDECILGTDDISEMSNMQRLWLEYRLEILHDSAHAIKQKMNSIFFMASRNIN